MIDITFLKKTIVRIMFATALMSNDIVKWNKQTHMHPAQNHTGHNLITSNLQFISCTYIAQQSCHIITYNQFAFASRAFCININLLTILYITKLISGTASMNQVRSVTMNQLRSINSQAGDNFQITSQRNTCNQFNMSHFFNSKQLKTFTIW